MARIQLLHMQDEARKLGLNDKSAGWLILEALQAATEGEWAAIAELLANGDATLLLPKDPPSVFSSASQLSASFAYDHTVFAAAAAAASGTRVMPAMLTGSSGDERDAVPVLTLSGLRGMLSRSRTLNTVEGSDQAVKEDKFEMTLQTFVVKTSQTSLSDLKDATSRHETLETLAPLPNVSLPDDSRCRYPTFTLSASNPSFPLPPPLNARTASTDDQAGGRTRSRSNSRLNAAGSRASASFASIFGGSGRERRRQTTAERMGPEMVDPQRLAVGAASESENANGRQSPSKLGVELRAEAREESSEDAVSSNAAESCRRTVSVWVVDHLVRRSSVMRSIRKTLDARVKKRLSAQGIPGFITEVVASFAATYLPPVPSLETLSTNGADRAPTANAGRSRASSPINIANLPYLADPDDMSDNVQEFYSSVRDQLYKLDSDLDHQHERVETQLEVVESVLCEEVYDRLFCPVTSKDRYHDDALSSRIAALNVLGLSLRHLGLDVPTERGDAVVAGLEEIVKDCGEELQRLESCRSPKDKLEVLVRAHKIAVEGVAKLPSIKMRDDAEATTQKTGETTSADTILPILIYSIVSSNPSRLASNLLYIERFRAENLVQGQTSYCLVNVQAAVAFLENVDVKDLGLDASQIGTHLSLDTGVKGVKEETMVPTRFGVKLAEAASSKIGGYGGLLRMLSGDAGENGTGRRRKDASRPVASRSSTAPTDYSRADEQTKDMPATSTAAAVADKPTIGDRLAMLGRLGASALSSSPSSSSLGLGLPTPSTTEAATLASPRTVSRELPGPPPPSKPAAASRTTSYLAAQLNRITAPRSVSTASLVEEKPLPASLQSPYPPVPQPPSAERPLHVVLASTGSVASVKIPLIVEELMSYSNVRVQIVASDSSLRFYDRRFIDQYSGSEEYTVASLAKENSLGCSATQPRAHLWTTADEWSSFTAIGDPILHIELRRWADMVLIAPTSANTLAKLNAGICDDLLTCFLRACGRTKEVVLFPAMNTGMWMHPLTEVHVKMCKEVLGYEVRGPVEKRLACGDLGGGGDGRVDGGGGRGGGEVCVGERRRGEGQAGGERGAGEGREGGGRGGSKGAKGGRCLTMGL